MKRARVNAGTVTGLAALVLAAWSQPAVGVSRMGVPFRPLATTASGAVRSQAASADDRVFQEGAHAPASVILSTVDSAQWTGYENAVYAADDQTVYVAYKRFTQDPAGGGYVPAELRVAKSTNGGATWAITAVTPNAIEEADTLDGSVAIDGDHASTVYVAYYVRASGLFADMKLKVAKSSDGGLTWTIQTLAAANIGDYTSIRVLDTDTAVVSAHGNGSAEGVHVYVTTNGGATWNGALVESGLGAGIYTSVGAAALDSIFVSSYDSLYPNDTDLHGSKRVRGSWRTAVVDGTPGDLDLTGLGSSIWVAEGPVAWIAYEADTSLGAFVRVAKSSNGSPWTIVDVQQGGTIGWNTAVHAVGLSDVYASYWQVIGSQGMAMFATSADGGSTWSVLTVPDPQYVQPYLDSTAPSTSTQYVSYQVQSPSSGATGLRVAKIQPA